MKEPRMEHVLCKYCDDDRSQHSGDKGRLCGGKMFVVTVYCKLLVYATIVSKMGVMPVLRRGLNPLIHILHHVAMHSLRQPMSTPRQFCFQLGPIPVGPFTRTQPPPFLRYRVPYRVPHSSREAGSPLIPQV